MKNAFSPCLYPFQPNKITFLRYSLALKPITQYAMYELVSHNQSKNDDGQISEITKNWTGPKYSISAVV